MYELDNVTYIRYLITAGCDYELVQSCMYTLYQQLYVPDTYQLSETDMRGIARAYTKFSTKFSMYVMRVDLYFCSWLPILKNMHHRYQVSKVRPYGTHDA
jgi:hypothetical protein